MKIVSQQSYFQYVYKKTHLGTMLYSRYSTKIIIKHMITESDIFAMGKLAWQCSTEGHEDLLQGSFVNKKT